MTDLGPSVITHLTKQLVSTRRLLEILLRQGVAIRGRDAQGVLAAMDEISTEMTSRAQLEDERVRLLTRAASATGVSFGEVTLSRLSTVLDDDAAARARSLSAELRGLLDEIAREHRINRALLRQEMQFLDHLTRLTAGEPEPGYRRSGSGARAATPSPAGAGRLRVLDMKA